MAEPSVGQAAPPPPTHRLFFALMPDREVAARAEVLAWSLGAEHGIKPRRAAIDKFHITLCHVGDFVGLPAATLADARRMAEGLHGEPIEIRLGRLASFGGARRRLPYVLLAEELPALLAFQARMQAGLPAAGLTQGRQHPRYTPHLTLLYGHHPLAPRPIVPPLAWTAREFVLVCSLIGRAHYDILGRWPLTPAAP